ncbi:MAG: hypothetical protein ACO36I_14400, partial [Candidatus Latescibacterota bacterium]
NPANICLSVDGAIHGEEEVSKLAQELGISTAISPTNRGKLSGAQQGAIHLLKNPDIQYIAIVDQDGDTLQTNSSTSFAPPFTFN